MSRLILSRFLSLTRAPLLVRPTFTPTNFRLLASWGPDKKPLDLKEVELRVFKSLATHDKVDQKQVNIGSHLSNDLGLDSLDQVEIMVALEDEFNIEIDEVASEKIFTVKDIVDYVVNQIQNEPDKRQNPGQKYDPNMTFGSG